MRPGGMRAAVVWRRAPVARVVEGAQQVGCGLSRPFRSYAADRFLLRLVVCVYEQGSVTELDDVRKVFADGDVDGVVVALGGKTADVGKTMLTDGKCMSGGGGERDIPLGSRAMLAI